MIEQFVEVVTPIADYSYRWKLNTGCKKSKEERADLMSVSEKPILTFTIDFVSVMVLESSSVLNAIHLIHEQTNKAHRQN